MLSKLYAQIRKYVSENFKSYFIFFITFLILTFPLPYYIDAPGGAINIADKITIDKKYQSKGSLNFAYVSELKVTPIMYFLSFFKKDWKIVRKSDVKYDNETIFNMEFRNKMLLEEANDDAVMVAYKALNKYVKIKEEKIYVTYLSSNAQTDLKIGDQILDINGEEVDSKAFLKQKILSYNVGDVLEFSVKNEGKIYKRKATLIEEDGNILIGAMMTTNKTLETDPKLSIKKDQSESGPSGGLMLALAIYDCLTKEDITKGRKIVGTGTIDSNGTVGSIGGVEFKLKGAVKEGADVFLVPAGENYEQAVELKKKRNYKIKIQPVYSFDEALKYLYEA